MFTKVIAILVYLFSGEGAIIRKIQEVQMKRVCYWQLRNMTDRELKDIGLSRSDIYRVVHGGEGRGKTA